MKSLGIIIILVDSLLSFALTQRLSCLYFSKKILDFSYKKIINSLHYVSINYLE